MTSEKNEQSKKKRSDLEETVELMKQAKRRRIEEINELDLLLGQGTQKKLPVASQPMLGGGESGSLLQVSQGIGQNATLVNDTRPHNIIDSPATRDLLAWIVLNEQQKAAASQILKMVGNRSGTPPDFTPYMFSNGLY